MELKVFISQSCPRCYEARRLAQIFQDHGTRVNVHDVGTADGLAEAAFYGVQSTPTVLVIERDEVVQRWSGQAPKPEEVRQWLK